MEQLKEYLEKLESADMTAAFCIDGEEEAEVRGVTFDSKEVVSGGIFVCKGKNFRVEYLKEALERGCICYVSEKRYELSEETAWIQVKDIRKAMPVLASIFYRTEPLPLLSPASREPRERRPLPIILRRSWMSGRRSSRGRRQASFPPWISTTEKNWYRRR